jgi:hypothetical protein
MITYTVHEKIMFIGHVVYLPESEQTYGLAVYKAEEKGPPHKPVFFAKHGTEIDRVCESNINQGRNINNMLRVTALPTFTVGDLQMLLEGRQFEVPDIDWSVVETNDTRRAAAIRQIAEGQFGVTLTDNQTTDLVTAFDYIVKAGVPFESLPEIEYAVLELWLAGKA